MSSCTAHVFVKNMLADCVDALELADACLMLTCGLEQLHDAGTQFRVHSKQ